MKIALMSFHNACNYGAALQAYALQNAVSAMGAECEYIDYINKQRAAAYSMSAQLAAALKAKRWTRAAKVIAGTPVMHLRGKRFRRFYRAYLKKTPETYHTPEEAASLNDRYDRFIAGSDQVWNNVNNGNDCAFLLNFVKDSEKKCSYASSFGMSSVPDELKTEYASSLQTLGRIAVREKAGADLVADLTGRSAHLVLDPVFLPEQKVWETISEKGKKSGEPYIFFYTNRNSQIKDFLLTGFPMENRKKHILSTHIGPKDFFDSSEKIVAAMSPEQFLSEIANADYIVTASFHCVAFAIRFHKPFSAIMTGVHGKDERLRNLLKLAGLESRILTSAVTAEQLAEAIDYDRVEERLRPYMEYSREYLRAAVFGLPDPEEPHEERDERETYICLDERCTGCTACASICPTGAISMRRDSEGFSIPVREEKKCIHCMKCHEVCQAFQRHPAAPKQPECYAVRNSDEIRYGSSSGGAFTMLSDLMLKRDGVIFAAGREEDLTVKHRAAQTTEERDQLRGSQYVQSEMDGIFTQVNEKLREKMPVLFVGTPCQVAGLNHYLAAKKTETDTLITCDIICHGVPSPMVYAGFLAYLRKRGSLKDFLFRDKALGWKRGYTVSAVFADKKVSNTLWVQSFSKLFSHNVINRLSCGNCSYTNYNRCGDITIGDFWGIEKNYPDQNDGKGTSLVLCSTEKGREFFHRAAEESGALVHRVSAENTRQNSLLRPAAISTLHTQFFRRFRAGEPYEVLAAAYGECNLKGFLKERLRGFFARGDK